MVNVKIEYKSGKIEIISIELKDYTKMLTQLTSEKRLVSLKII